MGLIGDCRGLSRAVPTRTESSSRVRWLCARVPQPDGSCSTRAVPVAGCAVGRPTLKRRLADLLRLDRGLRVILKAVDRAHAPELGNATPFRTRRSFRHERHLQGLEHDPRLAQVQAFAGYLISPTDRSNHSLRASLTALASALPLNAAAQPSPHDESLRGGGAGGLRFRAAPREGSAARVSVGHGTAVSSNGKASSV